MTMQGVFSLGHAILGISKRFSGKQESKSQKRIRDRKKIRGIIGVEYKDCSATWREVKKKITKDQRAFVFDLRTELFK